MKNEDIVDVERMKRELQTAFSEYFGLIEHGVHGNVLRWAETTRILPGEELFLRKNIFVVYRVACIVLDMLIDVV